MRKKELIIAALVAAGLSQHSVAEKARVSRASVARRLADPEFRVAVEAARRKLWERTTGKLAAASVRAANKLCLLLKSGDEKIQLHAAKAILENSARFFEQVEVLEKLKEIESKVDGGAR